MKNGDSLKISDYLAQSISQTFYKWLNLGALSVLFGTSAITWMTLDRDSAGISAAAGQTNNLQNWDLGNNFAEKQLFKWKVPRGQAVNSSSREIS